MSSSFFSTKLPARLAILSATSFDETVPDNTALLPLARTSIDSLGNSSLSCAVSTARSRCTMTSYRRMLPARSQTNIEIVPAALPLMSSSLGEVTWASATSALVSETRAIGLPADAAGAVPDEHRNRARRLAIDEQLARRGDVGVGHVGARQRDARDRLTGGCCRRGPRRTSKSCPPPCH